MSKINHQPSEAELEILQILWNDQPLTVREVHEIISQTKSVNGSTSDLIMHALGNESTSKEELEELEEWLKEQKKKH